MKKDIKKWIYIFENDRAIKAESAGGHSICAPSDEVLYYSPNDEIIVPFGPRPPYKDNFQS